MAKITERLRYVKKINGRLFWEPSKAMREIGFQPLPLGPDCTEARERAKALYTEAKDELTRIRHGLPAVPRNSIHAPGSLAHFYHAWIESQYFRSGKARRTIEEYHTAWKHIGPQLGDKLLTQITLADCENFDLWLKQNTSMRTRKRAMAKLKQALAQAHARRLISINPAAVIRTQSPPPRQAVYFPNEVHALINNAEALDMHAMSLCIRLIYACGFAPIDARTLTLASLGEDHQGPFIRLARRKTGVEGLWTFDRDQDLPKAIIDYTRSLGVDLLPDAPIFRRHIIAKDRGYSIPWRDETEFSKDFRRVRIEALGPNDSRTAYDLRRTFNVEAKLGEASPEERAAIMANGLHRDNKLDQTYSPASLEAARQALKKSVTGRDIRAQIGTKTEQDSESFQKSSAQFFGMKNGAKGK
ncbi:MAG: phage integrase SAM-like domain-containing protein [Pseudomonadota bacterium]